MFQTKVEKMQAISLDIDQQLQNVQSLEAGFGWFRAKISIFLMIFVIIPWVLYTVRNLRFLNFNSPLGLLELWDECFISGDFFHDPGRV